MEVAGNYRRICAEHRSICKISMQTGTAVRCGVGFVITFFGRRHREATLSIAGKCLGEKRVCFGDVGSWVVVTELGYPKKNQGASLCK